MNDRQRPPDAMAFTDADIGTAIETASAFSGDGGRVASLRDIIDARLASSDDAIAWQANVTTSSIEYVGTSKGGVPMAVVAHGNGPLADPECMIIAYLIAAGMKRPPKISDEEFHGLLDGNYGDVEVYDIRAAVRRREFHLMHPMTMDEAAGDPMVRARLGDRCEEFLNAHHRRSREWQTDQGPYDGGKCVVGSSDPDGYSYFLLEDVGSGAVAHPLRIGAARGYRHCHLGKGGASDHVSLVTDIDCHSWRGKATTVGVRGTDRITGIHPGIDAVRAWFRDHWRIVRRKNLRRSERLSARALVNLDGAWFTRYPRIGIGADDWTPHHAVTDIAPIERGVEVTVPYRGRVDIPVYDPLEVLNVIDVWANAYHVIDEPNPRWLKGDDAPSHVTFHVDAYRIEADTEWYLPPFREIQEDFERVLRFPSRLPSHLA